MAAIASQQALAAKTSVAGAKLNLKNKAARKTVKAFSARAQAVATKAVRHAADRICFQLCADHPNCPVWRRLRRILQLL